MLAKDLMHPSLAEEMRRHKKKRLVQSPNSFFMDVKCLGCYRITTVFSHAQTAVVCPGCSVVLCSPSGGKCRVTSGTEKKLRLTCVCMKMTSIYVLSGCAFRKKCA
uniref:40S ribosomal protein S27 n=1 Tax=Oryzias latipes TaxID=8090 RepID=A0A3P9J707_ORYLA